MNALVPAYGMTDLERIARAFAASKLFGIQNVDQALALCLIAQAEGRHPASAAQDYHIVQGRPAKKAEAMMRDFISAGGKVEWHRLDDGGADATFSHPAGGAARITWDMDRAKRAGLSTDTWRKYPRQMLRSRVVSEGVRTVYPMATSGMYVPEEQADIEYKPVKPALQAKAEPIAIEHAPLEEPTPERRKSAAQAKRDGDDVYFKTLVAAADWEGLDEIEGSFEDRTRLMPASWLMSMRDLIELRREELTSEAKASRLNGELDDGFAEAMRE